MKKLNKTNEKEHRSLFLHALREGTVEIMGTAKSEQIFSSITNGEMLENEVEGKDGYSILENLGNEFAIRFQRNTANGLMIRIGEASFSYLRKENQQLLELGLIENRLKPIAKRFEESLQVLGVVLSRLTQLNIQILKKSDTIFCLEVFGNGYGKVLASDLHLFYIMGILRGFCLWLDSRKEYSFTIEEGKAANECVNFVCMRIMDIE
jgi:hypothetical protein